METDEPEERGSLDAQVSDILRKAAQVIRDSGWCQYQLGPARCDAGPHCALGAIYCISPRDSQVTELARRRLSRFLIEEHGMPWSQLPSRTITNWNDVSVRSGREVVAALEGAAEAV